MDFGLTETQELIRRSAKEFLKDESNSETIRAVASGNYDALEDLWKRMLELGWPALIIPEEFGGAGFSFGDLAVLLEELGATLAPVPMVESAITSWIIERYGSESMKSEILPQIVSGDILLTPSIVERNGSWDTSSTTVAATKSGTNLVITGEKRFVAFAQQATHSLATIRLDNGQPALVTIPIWKAAGVHQTPIDHAAGVPVSSITFNEVLVPEVNIVAKGNKAIKAVEELVSAGGVARAAQLAGLGKAVLNTTVSYAANREQFGQPIGAFQAVQHHLAHSAAYSFSRNGYSYERAAQAKIAASEKISALCWTAHQCHGAIGFTWEHDLHLYTRRALAWKTDYGDANFHKSNLADAMGL